MQRNTLNPVFIAFQQTDGRSGSQVAVQSQLRAVQSGRVVPDHNLQPGGNLSQIFGCGRDKAFTAGLGRDGQRHGAVSGGGDSRNRGIHADPGYVRHKVVIQIILTRRRQRKGSQGAILVQRQFRHHRAVYCHRQFLRLHGNHRNLNGRCSLQRVAFEGNSDCNSAGLASCGDHTAIIHRCNAVLRGRDRKIQVLRGYGVHTRHGNLRLLTGLQTHRRCIRNGSQCFCTVQIDNVQRYGICFFAAVNSCGCKCDRAKGLAEGDAILPHTIINNFRRINNLYVAGGPFDTFHCSVRGRLNMQQDTVCAVEINHSSLLLNLNGVRMRQNGSSVVTR